MANKLEIGVEADTSGAQKGLKDLEHDIKNVGKAAEDASDQAAKSTSSWSQSLSGVKDSLPTASDAKGIEAINDATIVASKSTAIIETRMQKLSRTMSDVGKTLAAGFSQAFTGLANTAAAAGRMIGTALITGLKVTAVGAIVALGLTIFNEFKKVLDKVTGASAEAAEAIKNAFAAGLEVEQFRAFEGLGQSLGLTAEAASDLAASMGPLQEKMKTGGEDAKQLGEAIRLMGGDLSQLDPTKAESLATLLASIQSSYQKLEPLARQKLLSMMFEGADMATLAAIDQRLMGTAVSVGQLTTEIDKYQKAQQEADRWNSQMAGSWDRLKAAAGNLYQAWLQLTGLGPAFQDATSALPAMVDTLAEHMNKAAEVVRNLPTIVTDAANATIAAFKKMFDDLVAAATAGWNAVMNAAVNAINAGIEKIKALWKSLVDTVMGYVKSIQNAMPSMPSWLGGGGQRQAVPMPFAGGSTSPMMRTAAATTLANPYSAFAGRAAPFSANQNFGTGFTASMDRILFRWDEYKRSVEEAAVVTQRAGQTINSAMATAAAGTDGLTRSASAANDNLATMDETATQMDSAFSSWAQSATMGFIDAMMAGEDFRDTLADLLRDLARLALQKWVLGPIFGGTGAGLFSAPAGLNAAAADTGMAGFGLLRAPSAAEVSGLANIAGREQTQLGGTTTVNNNIGGIQIDMATGQVAATTEDGRRIGQQIEKAVQAILLRESKSGGILRKAA